MSPSAKVEYLCLQVREAQFKYESDIPLGPLSHHKSTNPQAKGWEGRRGKELG